VHLWTVPTLQGQQLTTTERAFAARLLPDGTHMVLGKNRSSDTLEVFDLRKGAGVRTLDEHWDGVTAIDASLLSSIVASGSRDHSVVLWDLRDWSVRHRLEGPKDGVLSVSVSDDGTRIAATDETSVHVWDG
jgi:WD40 repeat protein